MSDKAAPAARSQGRASAKKELPEHFRDYKHVWVFVELERGDVHPVSWELLGEGRKLADKLGVELAARRARRAGRGDARGGAEAFAYGADRRLSGRESGPRRLSQRALHEGDDAARQHA